jgi:shikimate kinase
LGVERVVLIGFMASGKTEVGEGLAERLGWLHVDLDREIEAHAGTSIAELFETAGEGAFRALEVRLTPEITRREQVVISTGGGWVTNPGLLSGLPPGSFTVFLRVSPVEVRRRLQATGGQPVRPLLRGNDPEARIAELMATREPLYRQAEFLVETDQRTLDEVIEIIFRAVRERTPAGGRNATTSNDQRPAARPRRANSENGA